MNSYQTLNSKLNIDEPLKAIKVIDFLFFSFVLGLIDITAAGYYYLPAIALKAAAAFWPTSGLKGIVHPKMKILSSFTPPQVVPNLYECLCSAEHKGRYSEECGKQSSSGAPLTSIVFFFPTMEVNGAPAWLQTFFKISSFVFSGTKNFFHFWVNYPFKA